jgi:hypothetical protein
LPLFPFISCDKISHSHADILLVLLSHFLGVPKILNAPVSSIILKENEPLKLFCSVDKNGDPKTHIEWIRAGNNAIVGRGEVFSLDNIKLSDAGRYYCKAQNSESAVAAMAQTDVDVQCK